MDRPRPAPEARARSAHGADGRAYRAPGVALDCVRPPAGPSLVSREAPAQVVPAPSGAVRRDEERARARGRYKRAFDLTLLAAIGLLLAPLWVLLGCTIALAIKLEDGGRVLHVQSRAGRGGKPFRMLKFRTMRVDAERGSGPVWARPDDRRSTRVGRVLRRMHLDELPQALNVARGEMSLVGPRPERPELAARIARRVPGFDERLAVRPGIAGLAQARGGYHLSPRNKLRYDRLYIAAMRPALDLRLVALCACKALSLADATPARQATRQ